LKTWNKEVFNTKVSSLNQALSRKGLSSLEFDGLLLRVMRVFDYVLFCFDEFEGTDDTEELKKSVFAIYDEYQSYISHPELVDPVIILPKLKDYVLPIFNVLCEIMEKRINVEEIGENPIVENFTDKEKKRFVNIISMISDFCLNKLNESYFVLGCKVTEVLFIKKESGIERGQVKTWAAGIIYAICKANGILGNNFDHFISPGEIYDYFSVSSSTVLLKSKVVIKLLDVVEGEERWQGESISLWDEYDDLNSLDSKDHNSNWTLGKLSTKEYEEYVVAREILSEVLSTNEPYEIIRAAKQCLNISRYVADAYFYLAIYEAKTIESACAYLNDGIDMIESAWDDTAMKEMIGHFWMDIDTRPYMRLLNAKLEILEYENKLDEAIEVGRRMISLSLNDNLGVRYQLINLFLRAGDFEGIDELNDAFEQESSLGWNYSIALRYFKDNQLEKATGLLKKAFEANEHIAQYLIGSKAIRHPRPDHYSVGSDEEAILYAETAKGVWAESKDAIKWLKAVKLGKPFIHALR